VKSKPKRVSASRKEALLRIEWDDGRTSECGFGTLRAACPCADCRASHDNDQGKEKVKVLDLPFLDQTATILDGIQQVGNYAVRMVWRDGHNAGIYTWEYLDQLCPNGDPGDERR